LLRCTNLFFLTVYPMRRRYPFGRARPFARRGGVIESRPGRGVRVKRGVVGQGLPLGGECYAAFAGVGAASPTLAWSDEDAEEADESQGERMLSSCSGLRAVRVCCQYLGES